MLPLFEVSKAYMNEKYKNVDTFFQKGENLSHLQRIIHLQAIANLLFDAYNYATKVTKSHNPTVNTTAQIVVSEE